MSSLKFSFAQPLRITPTQLVAFATIVAALMRFVLLDRLPPQIWFDEVWFSWKARELLQTGALEVYYKTYWGGVHPAFVILTAAVNVLGINGTIAPRIVAALAGTLCIPVAYFCFGEFLREDATGQNHEWAAAITSLILATLSSLVVISRVGLEWSLAATLTLTCVWLFHLAQRKQSLALWAAMGAVLGASQYLSQHMRFLAPLVALFVMHDALSGTRDVKKLLFGASVAAIVAVVVASPLMLFFAREPQWLTARASIIVNAGKQSRGMFWLNNAGLVARSLAFGGSRSTLDNIPSRALLDPIQLMGFGVGLVWVIVHAPRSAVSRKLLMWLPVMAAPTILSEGAPSFERMVNAMPAIAMIVALGWIALWRAMNTQRTFATWLRVVPCAVLAISSAANIGSYAIDYPRAPKLRADFTAGITDLMHELITRSSSETVFAEHLLESTNTPHQDFMLPGTSVRYLDFRQCLPLTTNRATRTTYLVNSGGDSDAAKHLAQLYPQATITPFVSESSWLLQDLTLIEVPANTRPAPHALPMTERRAVFAPGMTLTGYSLSSEAVKVGDSLFVTLYWQTTRDIPTNFTAFLHVDSGDPAAPVLTQRDGQPCQGFYPTSQWHAGDLVPDSFAVTIPNSAQPGKHAVYIGWYVYPSLERQPIIDADRALPDQRAWLTDITITR